MLSKFKNVYVLAPHTDDGELGAGGTISKLIEMYIILLFQRQNNLYQKVFQKIF